MARGSVVNWLIIMQTCGRLTKVPGICVPIYLFLLPPPVTVHFACEELVSSGSFTCEQPRAVGPHLFMILASTEGLTQSTMVYFLFFRFHAT